MKAVICGADVAGLTLSWWLARDGWDVDLVECPESAPDPPHMVDLVGSGYDVAEVMGLLPQLRGWSATFDERVYVDPKDRSAGRLAYSRLARAFDDRMISLMGGDLRAILRAAVADRVALRHAGVEAVQAGMGGGTVALSDGSVVRGDIVVGADGVHSRVRELVFGPEERFLRYLGYHTAAYAFRDDQVRARVGNRVMLVGAPGRQAALYPIDDGRLVVSFVHAMARPDLPRDPFPTVNTIYGQLGGLVRRALRHYPVRTPVAYDQVTQVEMGAWSRGRVILVGDACQAVSLLTGESASIAMTSAYVLASELHRRGPVSTAAARYEERLRGPIRAKQQSARGIARWLLPDRQWRIAARRAALTAARVPGGPRLMRACLGATGASMTRVGGRQVIPVAQ